MDQKKTPNRSKRQSKLAEENYWDCSVCTYRNSAEAFKCLMCDVRKGTSTRKPRINPQLVAQQVAQQQYTSQVTPKVKKESSGKTSEKKISNSETKLSRKVRPKLMNVDRSTAQHNAVTVNNVTVIITEFQPKRRVSSDHASNSSSSSCSGGSTNSGGLSGAENGCQSDLSTPVPHNNHHHHHGEGRTHQETNNSSSRSS